MDNLPRLFSQAPVAVGMEGKRFTLLEPPEPPLHSNALGRGLNQRKQKIEGLLHHVCGFSACGEPKRGVVGSHVLHSFRSDGPHGASQPAEERWRQGIFE
jgi:hypothetical protein